MGRRTFNTSFWAITFTTISITNWIDWTTGCTGWHCAMAFRRTNCWHRRCRHPLGERRSPAPRLRLTADHYCKRSNQQTTDCKIIETNVFLFCTYCIRKSNLNKHTGPDPEAIHLTLLFVPILNLKKKKNNLLFFLFCFDTTSCWTKPKPLWLNSIRILVQMNS